MTAAVTVTVECVPDGDRDKIGGAVYAVAEHVWTGTRRSLVCYHLPSTDTERAMSLLGYAQHVADVEGLRYIKPGPWIPGVEDDYADVVEDGNGLVGNRRAPRRAVLAS